MQDPHYKTLPQSGPAMQCLPRSSVSQKSLSSSVVLGVDGCRPSGFEVLISSKLRDDPEGHEEAVESAEFATEYVLL